VLYPGLFDCFNTTMQIRGSVCFVRIRTPPTCSLVPQYQCAFHTSQLCLSAIVACQSDAK